MKKNRILSGLLALLMLVSLIPVAVVSADEGTENGTETGTVITNWNDLYIKDGLVALFDAYGADNTTLDLSAGKWTGYKVVDGALVLDETLVATVKGGAYDAATNATGWVKGANGGFSYADPELKAATNGVYFDKALLGTGDFTVESVLRYEMRNKPNSTQDVKIPDMKDGAYTLTLPIARGYTNLAATFTVQGEANATVTVNFNGTDVECTLDENGTYTYETTVKSDQGSISYTVTVPDGVTLTGATMPLWHQLCTNAAFVFGSMYAMVWTNLASSNFWGNGYGLVRWYYAGATWDRHNGNEKNALFTASKDDGSVLKGLAGNLGVMTAVKTATAEGNDSYAITYAGKTLHTYDNDGTKPQAISAFQLLCGLEGEIYTVRVYNRTLTDAEKAQNKAVDVLQKIGYSLDAYNAMDEGNRALLLMAAAEADLETATVADFASIGKELTGYNALYVQDGLIGLYDAFNTDNVDLATGTWTASRGFGNATFYGAADKFDAAAAEYRSGLVYGPEKPEEAPLVYALVTRDGVERYDQ